MADAEGTRRADPENAHRTAIRTGLQGKERRYFVFDTRNGGYYTNGETEGVAEWPELTAAE